MKKNFSVPIAIGVAVIGCAVAVSANLNAGKAAKNLQQERYNRMLAEQDLLKANPTLQQMQAQLKDSQQKIDSIQRIVSDGKSTTSSLQGQVDTISKERDTLKQQIQQLQGALATQTQNATADQKTTN